MEAPRAVGAAAYVQVTLVGGSGQPTINAVPATGRVRRRLKGAAPELGLTGSLPVPEMVGRLPRAAEGPQVPPFQTGSELQEVAIATGAVASREAVARVRVHDGSQGAAASGATVAPAGRANEARD